MKGEGPKIRGPQPEIIKKLLASGWFSRILLSAGCRLVSSGCSRAVIISCPITGLASIRATGTETSTTHVFRRMWVELLRYCTGALRVMVGLLRNCERALSVGDTISWCIRDWCRALIHTLARVVEWLRISSSRAMLCRGSSIPADERGIIVWKFGSFGLTIRSRSTVPATTWTMAWLVLRLGSGGSWCTPLPLCFGFFKQRSPFPQAVKGKFWFKLMIFHTFDDCFNRIQLQGTWLILQKITKNLTD